MIHRPWFDAQGRINWLKLIGLAGLFAWLMSQGVLWLEQASHTPYWLNGLIGLLILLQGMVLSIREGLSLMASIKELVLKFHNHQPVLDESMIVFKHKASVVTITYVTRLHKQFSIMRC